MAFITFNYISAWLYNCNKYIREYIPLFVFLVGAKVTIAF